MSRKCLGAKADGSSPLARGLPVDYDGGVAARRIIPARAGFTRRGRSRLGTHRDHPRSRGVYRGRRRVPDALRGSSPLARGLPPVEVHGDGVGRIIPARAGFTRTTSCGGRATWDHPRSRGVYRHQWCAPQLGRGSSPLARGLRPRRPCSRSWTRIIPARAGFTSRRAPCPTPPTDHPRSRGVYGCLCGSRTSARGSSPLARGLLVDDAGLFPGGGIIPARAGFTRPPRLHAGTGRDHPRSRGVYPGPQIRGRRRLGSSPLARGLRVASGVPGNAVMDHPRSRGVYAGTRSARWA